MPRPLTFLCISCYFKGQDFLRACKAAGNTVYLVTKKSLEHKEWPRESVDEFFYLDSEANSAENLWNIAKGLAYLMRSRKVDRIVALDDFDVEKAAFLREQFRIPGMGQTTARYFRDKLAMRMRAADAGIRVPGFSPLFNDDDINAFTRNFPGPWVVKPRAEASAIGIKKVQTAEELWPVLDGLGEDRHLYLIEQFKPGDVYHADALSVDGKQVFCQVSQYLNTPFEVAHGGGVFRTHTVEFDGEDDRTVRELNKQVLQGFGMQHSASHTEYIKCKEDGQFYFLETSARVGGAHIAEMVTVSSGVNLWTEWAKLESAKATGGKYALPEVRRDYAGLLISLSRFEHPDTSGFNDPEIAWRINKDYHIGMIVRSGSRERVLSLLDDYARRVFEGFHASAPAPDRPAD
jgi:biotin carboxylase